MNGLKWACSPGSHDNPIPPANPGGFLLSLCDITPGDFQIGLLEGFEDSDPHIYTEQGAIEYALKMSAVDNPGSFYAVAYGVWVLPEGAVIAIAYSGDLYTP